MTRSVEVAGVLAGRVWVIYPASELDDTGEDPYQLAWCASAGLEDGLPDFGPGTGGGTLVRDTDTGEILATYRDGREVPADTEPFASMAEGSE